MLQPKGEKKKRRNIDTVRTEIRGALIGEITSYVALQREGRYMEGQAPCLADTRHALQEGFSLTDYLDATAVLPYLLLVKCLIRSK